MNQQNIFMAVITVIGTALLVYGVYALIKGEIQVIFGRRNHSTVTFTGTACDVIAGMGMVSGAATLVAAITYWLGALSFEIGFVIAVVAVLLYQVVAFIMRLLK